MNPRPRGPNCAGALRHHDQWSVNLNTIPSETAAILARWQVSKTAYEPCPEGCSWATISARTGEPGAPEKMPNYSESAITGYSLRVTQSERSSPHKIRIKHRKFP
jgi:hypothetical protein